MSNEVNQTQETEEETRLEDLKKKLIALAKNEALSNFVGDFIGFLDNKNDLGEYDITELLTKIKNQVDNYFETLTIRLEVDGMVKHHHVYEVKRTETEYETTRYSSLTSVIKALKDDKCNDLSNPKQVSIYPGIVQLCPDLALKHDVVGLIDVINAAKKILQLFVKEFSKPRRITTPNGVHVSLHPLLFENFSQIQPVQLFRKLHTISQPLERYKLTWRVKRRNSKLKKSGALNFAQTKLKEIPKNIDVAIWDREIKRAIDKIASLAEGSKYVRITNTPPTPQLMFRLAGQKKWVSTHSNLPLIMTGNVSLEDNVRLPNLVLDKLNIEDPVNFGWEPVCSLIGLYYQR